MAFNYPDDLKYLDTHEYARVDAEEKLVTVGISAFAVDQMGDVVFLELPEPGEAVEKGENFGTIESVKAVEELKAPVSGEVTERNEQLIEAPEQIADDPYGDGWLIKIRVEDLSDLEEAMDSMEYQDQVEG
ncbi:glycine cleavage system protein GcvH [Romeria aff. gracilis LEGE 07310]|uniref:Glycine cleavage system H protein n=1 Tax=Vasconcelosia minhoensis LEGE 07310 TaxID=915328 RepID=A0A8J7AVA8_9CYAN|nr:glycine cleavage system protein GcvH [Romeria gracilis]MBE9077583.1 glycine cleavage system protein GcvH [Romeria aff. gracilis LEGE 07310]